MNKSRAQWEMLNLIRKEKFSLILPLTMRKNNVICGFML